MYTSVKIIVLLVPQVILLGYTHTLTMGLSLSLKCLTLQYSIVWLNA